MAMKLLLSVFGLLFIVTPGAWSTEKDPNHEFKGRHEIQQDYDRHSEQNVEFDRLRNGEKPIFGWRLMSPAERQAHRQKLLSLRTSKERQAYQKQHYERMKKRAENMGVKLQDVAD